MPYFRILYRYKGRKRSLKLQASNREEVLEFFEKRELGVPLRIEKTTKPLRFLLREWKERIENFESEQQVKSIPYVAALRQIGIMIDAGMPIDLALKETIHFTYNRQLKRIFQILLHEIESGKRLLEAVKRHKQQIGELSVAMFRLGEESGLLSHSILKLANILEQIEQNRRMLKKATRYPAFIILAMMIAFGVVITMVIPQFQELFTEEKMKLPFPTRFLLWIEGAIIKFGPYILAGSLLLSSIYALFYKYNPKVRLQNDRMMLKIYIIGDVIRYAMLGRFLYVLQVLLEAGVPIVQALETAISVVENRWIRLRLHQIQRAINEGRPLNEGFKEAGEFDNIIIQMIKTGETGGALSTMLKKASNYYEDLYQYIVENIATLIEPILITAIAGFVLVLALGIFLPLWNMVEMAG